MTVKTKPKSKRVAPRRQSVKAAALELVRKLPERATWNDVMYRIYVRQQMEAGLKEADEGKGIPHEEVFMKYDDLYRVHARKMIQEGIEDADAGNLIPQEEVFKDFDVEAEGSNA